VGKRLARLGDRHQVLCVTHLPQIAAFADHHIRVLKESVGSRTETRASLLDRDQRCEELARMLGGEKITESARRHADELLQQARAAVGSAG
jgi:DNA repair protein RecN (Recombination protein N)